MPAFTAVNPGWKQQVTLAKDSRFVVASSHDTAGETLAGDTEQPSQPWESHLDLGRLYGFSPTKATAKLTSLKQLVYVAPRLSKDESRVPRDTSRYRLTKPHQSRAPSIKQQQRLDELYFQLSQAPTSSIEAQQRDSGRFATNQLQTAGRVAKPEVEPFLVFDLPHLRFNPLLNTTEHMHLPTPPNSASKHEPSPSSNNPVIDPTAAAYDFSTPTSSPSTPQSNPSYQFLHHHQHSSPPHPSQPANPTLTPILTIKLRPISTKPNKSRTLPRKHLPSLLSPSLPSAHSDSTRYPLPPPSRPPTHATTGTAPSPTPKASYIDDDANDDATLPPGTPPTTSTRGFLGGRALRQSRGASPAPHNSASDGTLWNDGSDADNNNNDISSRFHDETDECETTQRPSPFTRQVVMCAVGRVVKIHEKKQRGVSFDDADAQSRLGGS